MKITVRVLKLIFIFAILLITVSRCGYTKYYIGLMYLNTVPEWDESQLLANKGTPDLLINVSESEKHYVYYGNVMLKKGLVLNGFPDIDLSKEAGKTIQIIIYKNSRVIGDYGTVQLEKYRSYGCGNIFSSDFCWNFVGGGCSHFDVDSTSLCVGVIERDKTSKSIQRTLLKAGL